MIHQYLKGPALKAVKQAFRAVGINFTRTNLVKVIPFGVGASIGGAGNYLLTRYVGRQAKEWFIIDQTDGPGDGGDDNLEDSPIPSPTADGNGYAAELSAPPGTDLDPLLSPPPQAEEKERPYPRPVDLAE